MTKWTRGYDTGNYPAIKALAFGIPQHFDSSNGRQTAFADSKILCYLLDTICTRLQLDLSLH